MLILLSISLLLLSYYDTVKVITGVPVTANDTSTPDVETAPTTTISTISTNTASTAEVITDVTSKKSCKTRSQRPTIKLDNCVEIGDRIVCYDF